MILKPFATSVEQPTVPTVSEDAISEALKLAGVGVPTDDKANAKEAIKKIFEDNGAGIEDVARTIGSAMRSPNEANQIRAAEFASRVHEITKEIEDKKVPSVTINIIGNDNKTLVNLLMPQV